MTVHTSDDTGVRAIASRLPALWADVTSGRAGVEAMAALFTPDADFVVGDGTHLRGRDEIAAYFQRMIAGADAFGTSIRGTTVTMEVQSVRCLAENVALMISHGGILFPGESEVPPERRGIQTTVLVRQDGAWLAAAYQNTRIAVYS